MKTFIAALATTVGAAGAALAVPTTLSAGDIALIGRINNGTPDSFAFVTLVNIGAGTQIWFTDNGWTGTGFRGASATDGDGNENLTLWTAATDIAAGTIVASTSAEFTVSGTIGSTSTGAYASLAQSQTGDQITAFQSSVASNPLLNPSAALFTLDDTNGFEAATSAATGGVATGLTAGSTALTFNPTPLAGYLGVKASVLASATPMTRDQWLATFGDANNWEMASTGALATGSIAVTAVPEPSAAMLGLAGLAALGFVARRRAPR